MISELITVFQEYAAQNQVIAGAVSLWGLGVMSYIARNVPTRLMEMARKQLTTKLTMYNTHEAYFHFMQWLEANGYLKNVRSVKIDNGRWGDSSAMRSLGYGSHFFVSGLRPMWIELDSVEATNSSMERDKMTLTMLGRSHRLFNGIFEQIRDTAALTNKISMYKWVGWWQKAQDQHRRTLDSVFMDKRKKDAIVDHVVRFRESEDWYVSRGLSYQTGILLHGKPGTGKTSLIKAIASHFGMSVYILSASKLADIEEAMISLPDGSMIVIEDIDTEASTSKREDGDSPKKKEDKKTCNLGDILNSIDGLVSCHGRILVATTNHISKLSEALIRDGRFDLKVELGDVDGDIASQFFSAYYPDSTVDVPNPPKGLSPASMQNMILRHADDPDACRRELAELADIGSVE